MCLFELASMFPDPDSVMVLAMLIRAQGAVTDFFKQRALYHRRCWKHQSTIMLLRCLHGLLAYGCLDYRHLQALFFKRETRDTRLFFKRIRQIMVIYPGIKFCILQKYKLHFESASIEHKLNAVDQYKRFGVCSQ